MVFFFAYYDIIYIISFIDYWYKSYIAHFSLLLFLKKRWQSKNKHDSLYHMNRVYQTIISNISFVISIIGYPIVKYSNNGLITSNK